MSRPPRNVRFLPEIWAGLGEAAERNLRSRSKQIEQYVREGLARDGVVVDGRAERDR